MSEGSCMDCRHVIKNESGLRCSLRPIWVEVKRGGWCTSIDVCTCKFCKFQKVVTDIDICKISGQDHGARHRCGQFANLEK